MRRYVELTRRPGVRPLLAAMAVGRLPYGINTLALILLLRAEGISYAGVGLVTGAAGVAVAVTAPLQGRLIDRLGQTRILVTSSLLCLVAGLALALTALAGAGLAPLVALAAVSGGSTPPISPAMRALWPRLVRADQLDTAFAFDALQLEVAFVVGPLLAAGLAAAASPQAALLTGVTMQAGGAMAFAAMRASRGWRAEAPPGVRRVGALSAPSIRALVPVLALSGLALGALEIAIPAFAEHHATRGDAGWLFTLLALGSLAGGLWYGAHRWTTSAYGRFLLMSAGLAVCAAPLPLAASMAIFGVLVAVAGLAIAPSTAAAYALVGELAPAGALTEAYAWQIVGYLAGNSAGAWIGGALVDALGITAALVTVPAAALGGLFLLLASRGRLAPAATTARG